jgi:hypothetical protein
VSRVSCRQRIPWLAYPILWRPGRVGHSLRLIRRLGRHERVPNVWQVALGVLRMVHRMLFRSDTVGLCSDHPVRQSRRAMWFRFRILRFPFLVWFRCIAPFDLSGLISSPRRLIRHLVGTHHAEDQFAYDMEVLEAHPGALTDLRDEVRRIIDHDDRHSRWMRDLVVYEHYHETLLKAVDGALHGHLELSQAAAENPDVSLRAHLAWCAEQPPTPRATWRAWRDGTFRLMASGSYTSGGR